MEPRPTSAHRRNRHPPIASSGTAAASLLVSAQVNPPLISNPSGIVPPNVMTSTPSGSAKELSTNSYYTSSSTLRLSPPASPHIPNQPRAPSFTIQLPFANEIFVQNNTAARYLRRKTSISSSAKESLYSQASSRSTWSRTKYPRGKRPNRKICPEGVPARCTRFADQVMYRTVSIVSIESFRISTTSSQTDETTSVEIETPSLVIQYSPITQVPSPYLPQQRRPPRAPQRSGGSRKVMDDANIRGEKLDETNRSSGSSSSSIKAVTDNNIVLPQQVNSSAIILDAIGELSEMKAKNDGAHYSEQPIATPRLCKEQDSSHHSKPRRFGNFAARVAKFFGRKSPTSKSEAPVTS
ncbi:hypothetical protein SeLEV6574_g05850 [Synchytrium endobioticum]|uniref:Uncharacterized protein n=1 Tax=Synchytrium endobioticum TaxID=286115 RepID=A0A507CRZ3_9FUNG|nr:hypothetical protein SeLEV6574_g05850 [Synchytrium endobioticum]